MDPRQQHPFGRNTGSAPHGRPPFQQSSNQAPFPPSSHPQNSQPSYAEHQRRPSDSGYYAPPPPPPPPPRSYAQDAPSMPAPSHTRQLSSSSIGHGTPVNRSMPPPSSPQQQQHSQHNFPPSLPRGPPPSLGAPMSSLTASRDLPTLPPLRPGSSMSISSMLGAPAQPTRDTGYQPAQFPGPLPFSNAAHPSTSYAGSFAISSVAEPTAFGRRIRTPEPTRSQELHGPRDNRANSAGSPPRAPSMLTSPEVGHRYSTPQSYNPRPTQGPPAGPGEERRDVYPMRVPNTSLPPRPNSQPTGFGVGAPPPRPVDIGRSEMPPYRNYNDREPAYAHAERERQEREAMMQREREREHRDREFRREREIHADRQRHDTEVAYQREAQQREFQQKERERRDYDLYVERERARDLELRERENERERRERDNERARGEYLAIERARERDREMAERERGNSLQAVPPPYAHQQQSHHQYNRPYEPREQQQLPWNRGYEHPPPDSRPQQQQSQPSYEPPRAQAAYPPVTASHAPHDARYPPTSQPQSATTHHGSMPVSQNYESSLHDRQRREMAQSQQPFTYGGAGGQSGPALYQPHESPKRKQEDEMQMMQQQQQQQQQRERERSSFLGVAHQEINRRGRLSPLPQAVQGAQGKSNGPVVEPGIKHEFGKMFSGIGSGAIGIPATTATTIGHTPFSNPRHSHREDLDAGLEMNGESSQKANNTSRGGRRRKLKEEDSRDEDGSSTGRRTPNIRGSSKRPKMHHPPGGSSNSLHSISHRRGDNEHGTNTPTNGTPFKNSSGVISPASDMKPQPGAVIPHHHHVVRTHHHHHHHSVPQSHKPSNPSPIVPAMPKPKYIVKSKAVLDSVAHYPRNHLGSMIYTSELKPSNPSINSAARIHPTRRGYSSTPTPIPRFDDRENCTFTIQIPQVYLSKESREEITARRPVWGTEVYTDDSDVIAACIHSGWIRGEWPEDIDTDLLDLEIDAPESSIQSTETKTTKDSKGKAITLTKAPPRGPMFPIEGKDLHITILILPTLEKYTSSTRWGIRSREWGDHDGLSYMIHEIKWVEKNGGGGQNSRRKGVGKSRKFKMVMRDEGVEGEDEREKELFERVGGDPVRDLAIGKGEESFVRGEVVPVVGEVFKGLGVGSWWKGNGKGKGKSVEVGDKENREGDVNEKEAGKEGQGKEVDDDEKVSRQGPGSSKEDGVPVAA